MSEEADFEIDFYGDEGNDQQDQGQKKQEQQDQGQAAEHRDDDYNQDGRNDSNHGGDDAMEDENGHGQADQTSQQGTKRKQEDDGRPVDSAATTAIMISELNWWTTDDDIRGWARAAEAEDEIKDLTFSEHKINGKSKGQVYVEFNSRQAASATKHHLDKLGSEDAQGAQKKFTAMYWNANVNPFKTLPKDAPARGKDQQTRGPTGAYNNDRGGYGGNYRGRGNFNNRGNMGQNNYNRNFNNNNNNNPMGYNNNPMVGGGGYNNNPMGGGGGFNNFNNRGGMMGGGMRGGGNMRGGRGGNMMGMGPGMNGMGPMGMNPMAMMGGMGGMSGMGMGMMSPAMQGMNPGFNPGNFNFGQNQGGGGGGGGSGDWGNPHGAKRPRPE